MFADEYVPFFHQIDLFIDDIMNPYCLQADDEEGWAIARNPDTGEFERLCGRVRFLFHTPESNESESEMRQAITRFNRDVRPTLNIKPPRESQDVPRL